MASHEVSAAHQELCTAVASRGTGILLNQKSGSLRHLAMLPVSSGAPARRCTFLPQAKARHVCELKWGEEVPGGMGGGSWKGGGGGQAGTLGVRNVRGKGWRRSGATRTCLAIKLLAANFLSMLHIFERGEGLTQRIGGFLYGWINAKQTQPQTEGCFQREMFCMLSGVDIHLVNYDVCFCNISLIVCVYIHFFSHNLLKILLPLGVCGNSVDFKREETTID